MTSILTPEKHELTYQLFPEYQRYHFKYPRPVLRTQEQLEQFIYEELVNEFNCGCGAKRYFNANLSEETLDQLWEEFRQVNFPLKAQPCYVVLKQNSTYTEYELIYLSPQLTTLLQQEPNFQHSNPQIQELINLIRHENN